MMPTPLEKKQFFYEARVVSIYDGDTIRLDIDMGFSTWVTNTSVRLAALDAPELHGEERAAGLSAKAWLESVIPPGTRVFIRTKKDPREKFGRYLAFVFLPDGTEINATMVTLGHAKAYL